MMQNGKPKERLLVYAVESHATAADGRVSIHAGGAVYDGYQTDDGFYLEADDSTDRGGLHLSIVATPGETALSSPSGLYDLGGRTLMHLNNVSRPDEATWTGEAAVVVANDSVYIDVFLTNEAGGSAAATGRGRLRGERFEITTKTKKHFKGVLSNGRLYLDWMDYREWGHYQGRLTGRRK